MVIHTVFILNLRYCNHNMLLCLSMAEIHVVITSFAARSLISRFPERPASLAAMDCLFEVVYIPKSFITSVYLLISS